MGRVGMQAKVFLCLLCEECSPSPTQPSCEGFPLPTFIKSDIDISFRAPSLVPSIRLPLPAFSSSPHGTRQELIHIKV